MRHRAALRSEASGLVLLALALAFNLVYLLPEARIGRVPPNDLVFHRAASAELGDALTSGEPFLDPWVAQWGLGYPLWRSYQPLPHLLAGAVLRLAAPGADRDAGFALLACALLILLPASVYLGARLLCLSPGGAGLAAILVLLPSGFGDPMRFGIGYGATTWRGSGLFTQLVALHLLVPTLGLVARALDRSASPAVAALFLALTTLSHVIFGWVAFVSMVLLAVIGPRGEGSRRLARLPHLFALAFALLAWFVVPLALAASEINHSRFEHPTKWDSYGASFVLRELGSGRLLDWGRAPILTVLLTLAVVGAIAHDHPLARRLVALTLTWLALFFGRDTWGHLLRLIAVPSDLHLHRLQGAFETSAVLLVGWALAEAVERLRRRSRALASVLVAVIAIALVVALEERSRWLETNTEWGEANLAAHARARTALEQATGDVQALLAERPGRVSAGLARSWGGDFRIGDAPVYSFLAAAHLDQASFLYHAMSRASDIVLLRNEDDPAHDTLLAIRAVLAPANRVMPPHLRLRAVRGPIAVYEAAEEGYFGLVDVGGVYRGRRDAEVDHAAAWLASEHCRAGVVFALDSDGAREGAVQVTAAESLPPVPALAREPRGKILQETAENGRWSARVELARPAHVLLKINWFPDLVATRNGRATPVLRVTPGFAAIAVPEGNHEIVIRYQPGRGKPVLLLGGLAVFVVLTLKRLPRARLETALGIFVRAVAGRCRRPRVRATLLLFGLVLLAVRPLLRGRLIGGHDALAYPVRALEYGRALTIGPLPPLWAPDLGRGFGQPLFEFAPPLVYAGALALHGLGLDRVDSLQIFVALLVASGATAIYRLARRKQTRAVAIAAAAAWLFSPYLALDLFVRAAFAEAAAVALAPVALWSLVRLLDRPVRDRFVSAAIATALIPLAHNGIALLFLPALGLVALLVGSRHEDWLRRTGASAAALGAGLGLSAWFWLPALGDRALVHSERLLTGALRFDQHFITFAQLVHGRWGHGVSVPGSDDGLSFALAPLLVLGLLGARIGLTEAHDRALTLAFAAAALAGAFLATAASSALWERLTALQYLAYPWRALFLPALFLPLLAVHLFGRLERRHRRAPAVVVLLLMALGIPHTEPRAYYTLDPSHESKAAIARLGITTTSVEEYEPMTVTVAPVYRAEGLRTVPAASILATERQGARQRYAVRSETAVGVELSTFAYPGFVLRVDGTQVPYRILPGTGTIGFDLGPGRHQIELDLGPTPIRSTARWISLATLVGLAATFALGRLTRRGPRPRLPGSRSLATPRDPRGDAAPAPHAPRPRPPRRRRSGPRPDHRQ